MSTRFSARRLLSPTEDPERLLSRRNRSEPSLLFDLEEDDMAGQVPPQGLIPDLYPMEELLQAPTDGVGDAIVIESQSETTQTVYALKLPVLKTGDYDLWSMRMEQYLTHTDYALWEVIVNVDAPAVASASTEGPIPPKTAEQKLARKNKLKAKSTLLLAIPDEHLLKSHGIKDAKTLWEAIKARSEGLDKTYDKFQKLISQLEIHGEVIYQEDANLKLLRSLPSAWNNIPLIMRNKADLDELSMEDFTNEAVNTAHEVSIASSQGQASSSTYADDVMYSFFVNQSNSPQLDNEDLEQIDTDDLEEMDLKWQRDSLNKSNLEIIGYQLGLESLEARIVVHEKNEAVYEEDIAFLKYDVKSNELHDCHLNKSEVFESAYDSSVNETEEENNQVNDRFMKVEGYHAVPPCYTGNYITSRPDLSFAGLDDSVYKTNVSKTITSVPRNESTASKSSKNSLEQPKDVRPSAPIIEEWESDNDDDCLTRPSIEQNKPSYAKINFVKSVENTRKSVIEQNKYRKAENLRKSQRRVTGQREVRPVWNNAQRVNHQNKLTHPHPKRNFVLTAVATKSGLAPVNTAKKSSPRVAASISTARQVNTAASKLRVNAVNNVTTAGPKVVVSTAEGKKENAVKSSACWIWRPTGRVIDHISKDSGSYMTKRFDYFDPQGRLESDQGIFNSGCSRHMTGNKSCLTDYQDIDGGFVAFAGSPKGGKITGKGKIRTGKLDFEDVYFVKELKFNLFYLLDENQVLLKVPKQDNMYSFDIKNVVPSGEGKATQSLLMKGIKREFSVSKTPQQNGVAERKNRTLIEAAKTMLADSLLPTTFWAEAVNTACYVQNRVLVTKPHNKTPYELLISRPPRSGPEWLFDIDSLTKSMNYEPVTAGNQTNGNACIEKNVNAGQAGQEKASDHEYILLPLMISNSPLSSSTQSTDNKDADEHVQDFRAKLDNLLVQQKEGYANNTNRDSTASPSVSTAGPSINTASENINTGSPNINTASPIPNYSSMQSLENTGIFDGAYDDEDVGAEADLNNLETTMNVSPIPITRIHKDHPKDQIIGDINSATQTRRMIKIYEEHAMTLVDLLIGKRAIGTKWVFRNKKDESGIVIRNKARLVEQGYIQEEGIDYDEMDVKSAFLYGTIEEEVAWYETLSTHLLENGFRRGTIDKTLFIKKDKDNAREILDEFYRGAHLLLRIAASTPMEPNKALVKDEKVDNVDVHLYRSMIGSLMYLTASRPDITFTVCACARFQVTPKVSHLYAVKRIFRYLKGQPKLGLWYPRDSPFDLEAFSDSDYAGASLDRKSTTREYIAAANCRGQNPKFHAKTKHIEIRHHFIRDSYEKRLIQVIKVHSDHNVADLLTKAFDVSRDEFGSKTGSCKVNAARQVLVLLGRLSILSIWQIKRGQDTKIPQSSGPPEKVGDEDVHKELGDRMERDTTTAFSLEAEHDNVESHHTPISTPSTSQPPTLPPSMQTTHVVEKAATMPHDSPLLGVHTSRSDEGSITLNELMVLCTQLSTKVASLEADLKQTKKGSHEHDFEELDFEFTALEEDYTAEPDISTANVPVSTAGAEVSTASPEVRTAAKSLVYIRRSATKRKDKGKAIMKEAEPVQKKTKLQLEQERLGYTLQQLKKLSFDEIKKLFETTMKRVNTFTPMESDDTFPKIVAVSSKRDEEQELNQKSSKRQKKGEGSEPAKESKDELSQEQLQQLMIIVPEEGINVEALQTKYPIIDWEVYTEDSRMYWKIIIVGNHTEVELKRLFEPDKNDTLWNLQRYMHDPFKWKLYDTCGVHHVSTERGHDIFMLVEKDYLLTRALMTLMLCNKLFSPLYEIDTLYNSLNHFEQDSLNSVAGVSNASGSSTQDAHVTALTKQVEALLSFMNQPVNSIQNGCETCSGPHVYYECQATDGYTQEDGVLLSNTVPNPHEDLKVITTRSGITLAGPSVPSPPSSSSKEVERDLESTTDQVLTESTTRVPPPVVLPSPTSTSSELHPAPVSSLMIPEQNPHQPPIPYPSRLTKEKLQGKVDIQNLSFLQMFKKIYFNISFAKALAHMPKFAKMVKDLLTNKEKLLELANTPLNEN
ncbi:retrovirus-related pol polyprotein from transposon TNT 1-94 [Tanacetum coccineum]